MVVPYGLLLSILLCTSPSAQGDCFLPSSSAHSFIVSSSSSLHFTSHLHLILCPSRPMATQMLTHTRSLEIPTTSDRLLCPRLFPLKMRRRRQHLCVPFSLQWGRAGDDAFQTMPKRVRVRVRGRRDTFTHTGLAVLRRTRARQLVRRLSFLSRSVHFVLCLCLFVCRRIQVVSKDEEEEEEV